MIVRTVVGMHVLQSRALKEKSLTFFAKRRNFDKWMVFENSPQFSKMIKKTIEIIDLTSKLNILAQVVFS